jgi:hypothetical protein
MGAKESSKRLVSDEEKRSALNAALRKLAERLGVDPDLFGEQISFGLNSGLSPEREQELSKAMGLQIGFQAQMASGSMEKMLLSIQTKDDLDRFVQSFGEAAAQAPTIARKQINEIKAKLPRGGGPGRKPKLNHQQSTIVCKEILRLIGMQYGTKEALVEVSKMCPDLVQKKVGARTLQTIWSKRKEYLS